MARQKGLEPLAYCLEGSCSIQLSYWRVSVKLLCYTRVRPPLKSSACIYYHSIPPVSRIKSKKPPLFRRKNRVYAPWTQSPAGGWTKNGGVVY